jgi:anti-sigma B factor antagonist
VRNQPRPRCRATCGADEARRRATIHLIDAYEIPHPFEVRLDPQRERLVVVPRGELDVATAPRMADAVLEQFDSGFRHVVADLRELTFIDSSGIRTLWLAHQRAERDGVRLSVIPGDGEIRRALDLTGLLERMDLLEA